MKTLTVKDIIFHADDYGANKEISDNILDCVKKGVLRSISILSNSRELAPCMKLLEKRRYEFADKKLLISIHFNIAEGAPLSDIKDIPHLVNERGMFGISFFKLLILSFTGKGKVLKKELKNEYRLQLEAALPYIDEIRIDSHQHYHMIPVVLESILEVCGEASERTGKPITFIRIPAEPVFPFIKHPSLYPTIKPINIIKNMVLNFLNICDGKMLKPYRDKSAVFFGIMLSGCMDRERVKILLKDFINISIKKGLPLEVLAHPGGCASTAGLMDKDNKDCAEFYTSDGRKKEKDMMLNLLSNK